MNEERTTRRILDQIKRLKRTALTRSIGVVTSDGTDNTAFTVEIGGQPHSGLARLDAYTPEIDDRVLVIRSGGDLLVVGKIAD